MSEIYGFDLDGILVGRPPLTPKSIIDWLYKSHQKKKLSYRFPGPLEQKIRQLTHLPGIRPPIKDNCILLKQVHKTKKYKFFLVSSRFSFLEQLTYSWLKKHQVLQVFDKIYLNSNNEQPHLFKEKIFRKLDLDAYVDDDEDMVCYLAPKFPAIKFYLYPYKTTNCPDYKNLTTILDLKYIF
jgi:hypothetical protein